MLQLVLNSSFPKIKRPHIRFLQLFKEASFASFNFEAIVILAIVRRTEANSAEGILCFCKFHIFNKMHSGSTGILWPVICSI